MSLTTVVVSVYATLTTGENLANGRVRLMLTSADVDGSVIAPTPIDALLDNNGFVNVNLWPNARGTQNSQYLASFYDSNGRHAIDVIATIPASNCNLHDHLATLVTDPGMTSLATSTGSSLIGFIQSGTGAVARTAQDKQRETVSVKDFGAKGDLVTDDTAAIASAISAVTSAGGEVFLPVCAGYKTTAPLTVPSNVTLRGQHRYNSFISFFPTASGQAAIQAVSASNVTITNLRARNNGARAVNRVNTTLTHSGGFGVMLQDSTECNVLDCDLEWGSWGFFATNTVDDKATENWTTNKYHTVRGNRARESGFAGFEHRHASDCTIEGNHGRECGSNGFKFSGRNHALTVRGNVSYHNGGDGFDMYDGMIACTITGNIGDSNGFAGFELKGTFGGSMSINDYVYRDTTFSGNIATINGTYGFNIVSVRNCSFSANLARGNGDSGFNINNLQASTFVGETATKNAKHGFAFTNASNNVLVGCNAPDNSWVDGTTQNGTYNGFDLDSTSNASLIGCNSANSSTSGIKGGMGYGIKFAGTNSSILGGVQAGTLGDISGLAGNFRNGKVLSGVCTGAYQDATSGSVVVGPSQINVPTVLTLNATVPSVAGGNHFSTNSSTAKRYTDFSGANGQRIIIFSAEANTTVGNNSTISLQAGADLAAGAWTWIELVRNAGVWYEIAHK
jgi:hypothetical protein